MICKDFKFVDLYKVQPRGESGDMLEEFCRFFSAL